MRGEGAIEDLPRFKCLNEQARRIEKGERLNLLPERAGLLHLGDQAISGMGEEVQPRRPFDPFRHRSRAAMDQAAALSLAWSEERFGSLERVLRYYGRQERGVERIGKKYRWITWHKLQARLSDHFYLIGSAWRDTAGSNFQGPWQLVRTTLIRPC